LYGIKDEIKIFLTAEGAEDAEEEIREK